MLSIERYDVFPVFLRTVAVDVNDSVPARAQHLCEGDLEPAFSRLSQPIVYQLGRYATRVAFG